MSILIKGLKMPEDGEFLDLVITADGVVRAYDQEDEKIAEAVELPAHGDLMEKDLALAIVKVPATTEAEFIEKMRMVQAMIDAPVAIPAERNE